MFVGNLWKEVFIKMKAILWKSDRSVSTKLEF